MTKVIVIGAGVVGASAAYRLAQAGAEVLVLEAKRPGAGTSSISYAWTNAHRKPPFPYHVLNVNGMKTHAALRDEFGATPWWHGGGSLEWTEPERWESFRANIDQLRGWGYAASYVTPAQVRELEPDIDPAVLGDAPAAFFPDEGWCDPVVYIQTMLAAATRRHNARLLLGAEVVDLAMQADRVSGVCLADGTVHEADVVVNCGGRWINDAVREAGLHLPMAPTPGLLVFTPPVACGLSRVLHTAVINVRPDGAGRLMLHWDPTDATLSLDSTVSVDMPQVGDLMARIQRVFPGIGEIRAEAVRLGIRPIPGDGFTAVGPVPRVGGYYVAVTHSGVTMSPFLGLCVADEVMRAVDRPELADFRPARFFN